jgi:Tol biopolymer transport system component/DNA-binding winged helix-turn-helix (wHTH) protein
MPDLPAGMRVSRFGPYEVNLTTRELRKHGILLKLQDQPFQILALLLASPGRLVTREEISQRLWPSGTFVDFDNGLNTALSRLREALGDSADTPRFIETLARRGYRWMVPVDRVDFRSDVLPVPVSVVSSEREATKNVGYDPAPPNPFGIRVKLFYGSLLATTLLTLGLGWHWFRSQLHASPKVPTERQVTRNLPDDPVRAGEISPDGRYLAYTDLKGLHLASVQSGESHDIALPEELRTNLGAVTWFPNGEKLIVDAHSESEGTVLWLISILGGTPRRLRTHSYGAEVSPDGSSIAFISGHEHEIWLATAEGGNSRRFLKSESDRYYRLAWSPLSDRLAYLKTGEKPGQSNIFVTSIESLSLDGGSPSVVVSDSDRLLGDLVWLRDGHLVYAASEGLVHGQDQNLWEVMTDLRTGLPSGTPAKLTNWYGAKDIGVSASKDGSRLGVSKAHRWNDTYIGELKENGMRLDSPKRLTSSESNNAPSTWTRDSGTILFTSDRVGRNQIFKQKLDTDTPELLVEDAADQTGVALSADAAWILYFSLPHLGKSQPSSQMLMRFPSSGAFPEKVLEVPADPMIGFSCPSRTSSWCVISRWEQGQLIFYVLGPLLGQGKELIRTKLEHSDELSWSVSPDGSRIAIASDGRVRILDLGNGTERDLRLPQGWFVQDPSWAADGNTLFAGVISAGGNLIARIDLDGKAQILSERANGYVGYPHPSPDGRHLAYVQGTFENNVWLLENF